MNGPNTYYRRHLPHFQPEGETYHVVFRLAGSVPANTIEEIRYRRDQEEKQIANTRNETEKIKIFGKHGWKYFEQIEKALDENTRGPFWLRNARIAGIVQEAIRYRDRKEYDLLADSIMPNHVHMIFRLLAESLQGRNSVPPERECWSTSLVDHKTGSSRRRDSSTHTVTNILENLKWYTALKANRLLERKGSFWQHESYDHVIRDDKELERTIEYVLMNPVKAGLCKDWRDWKWSYVKEGFVGD